MKFFSKKENIVALAKAMDELWDNSAHMMEVIATISLIISQRERFLENPVKAVREISHEFHNQLRQNEDVGDVITQYWFSDEDNDDEDSPKFIFAEGVETLIDISIVMGKDFKSQTCSIVANCYEHEETLRGLKRTVLASYINILEENNRIQRLVNMDINDARNLKSNGEIAGTEVVELEKDDNDEPF